MVANIHYFSDILFNMENGDGMQCATFKFSLIYILKNIEFFCPSISNHSILKQF